MEIHIRSVWVFKWSNELNFSCENGKLSSFSVINDHFTHPINRIEHVPLNRRYCTRTTLPINLTINRFNLWFKCGNLSPNSSIDHPWQTLIYIYIYIRNLNSASGPIQYLQPTTPPTTVNNVARESMIYWSNPSSWSNLQSNNYNLFVGDKSEL